MIFESLGAVWAVECTCPRDTSSSMISESLWGVGLLNPGVIRDCSWLIISVSLGAVLGCPMHASPMKQFVDDF